MNLKSTGGEGGVTLEQAIDAACTALQEVGSKLIYRDGVTYSRYQCNEMARLLRSCAQDAPGVGELEAAAAWGYEQGAQRYMGDPEDLTATAKLVAKEYVSRVPPAPAGDERDLDARITEYLANGGFWNPEAMEHEKVRDLLMDCRAYLRLRSPPDAGVSEEELADLEQAAAWWVNDGSSAAEFCAERIRNLAQRLRGAGGGK